MKILFTGGGTGGHIFPILAIARQINKQKIKLPPNEEISLFYIGPKDEFSQSLFLKERIKTKSIITGKFRRYIDLKSVFYNIIDIFVKIPLGILQSFFYIFFLAPDLIVSKGGFGSVPAVISGWILRVPIFLHESDAVPGMANRLLSKLSLEIFTSFPHTLCLPRGKMIWVGNPIREEILDGSKERAKEVFNLKGGKPLILIIGGSQGSQRINDKILEILPEILKDFELIHQTGESNFKETKLEAKTMLGQGSDLEKYYHPIPFLKESELRDAFAVADLVCSRAGSGIIFEIASAGKPSVLIPLPESAQNHQLKNAYIYAEKGATIVIEEPNFTPHFFLERLKNIFSHPQELEKMGRAAKEFSKPLAGKIIASYIIAYLTKDISQIS